MSYWILVIHHGIMPAFPNPTHCSLLPLRTPEDQSPGTEQGTGQS